MHYHQSSASPALMTVLLVHCAPEMKVCEHILIKCNHFQSQLSLI